jgi:phage terminase large subunit GpA-like protein
VFAIKGIAGPNKPIWPKKATRNVAKKTDVFIIGVDQAKSVMQARLLIPAPDGGAEVGGPGFCHFPRLDVYDEAYFDGLTVEKAITKYKQGHPYKVWVCPDGKRNEPWDNAVYLCRAQEHAGGHQSPPHRPQRASRGPEAVKYPAPDASIARKTAPDAQPGSTSLKPGNLTDIPHERDSHMPHEA